MILSRSIEDNQAVFFRNATTYDSVRETSITLAEAIQRSLEKQQKLSGSSVVWAHTIETWHSILSKINELDEDIYDDEFLSPTPFARRNVERLLGQANSVNSGYLPLPNILADGSGGIRVEWSEGNKELRLLLPAQPSESAKLYYQEGKTYGIEPISSLIDRLNWLTN